MSKFALAAILALRGAGVAGNATAPAQLLRMDAPPQPKRVIGRGRSRKPKHSRSKYTPHQGSREKLRRKVGGFHRVRESDAWLLA